MKTKYERKKRFKDVYYDRIFPLKLTYSDLENIIGCPSSTIKDTCNFEDIMKYEKNPSKIKRINFNAEVVIGFCKHFDIDIYKIFYGFEKEPTKNNDKFYTFFRHSEDCQELQDEAFMGEFYGYTYNTMHNVIDNFTLNISKGPNATCNATLEIECFRRITDKKSDRIKKTLYGKPMHLKPNLVYIVFHADKGDEFYVFAFRYFKINYGKRLYCRYGSIITNKRETVRYPQMQSFVFFDSPIKQENIHYIEGFLKLSNDKIIVPASIFEKNNMGTEEQKECVKKFFEYCNDVQFHKEEYYCFSEKVLLALGDSKEIPKDIIVSTLMTLKEKSINPNTISYPDNTSYSKFLSALSETDEIIFNEDDE